MSSINVETLMVEVKQEAKGTRSWESMVFTHKVLGPFPKVDGKKLVSFNFDKEDWDLLKNAQKGDTFLIDREKSETDAQGRSYWNWVKVHRQDSPPKAVEAPRAANNVPTKPTYETPIS